MKKQIGSIVLIVAMLADVWLPGSKALAAASDVAATATTHPDPDALISQITNLLTHHPLVQSRGAQLLDVTLEGEAILINFDRQILDDGVFDPAVFTQLSQALDAELQLSQSYFVTFQIEGQTLDHWGMAVPEFAPAETPLELQASAAGPLSGKKIALNPGHGLYDKTDNGAYAWQRGEWWGIREDLVNAEIMMYAAQYFENVGATVIDLRQMDKTPTGPSGSPHWYEAAREYLWYIGLPSSVWNSGSTNLNKDIMARPYGANHYGADLLISLHNNGGGGTGTETWYDTTGDYHSVASAQSLAQAVNSNVVNAIRASYNGSWTDRGVKASNGGYGENHYARMPAALIEVAFMDMQSPDNNALHDETFKRLVAEALVKGVCSYYGVTCTNITQPPTQTPAAPSGLNAAAASSVQINLTWNDNSGDESGFKIERSPNGSSDWQQITTVGANVTSHANSGLSSSTTYYYRVRAYNAYGDSGYSNTASATTDGPPASSGTVYGYAAADTYAQAGYPTTPPGNQQNLYLGYDTPYSKAQTRIYIRFDLPSLPAGASVSSAQVQLNQYAVRCSGSYGITAYEITGDWDEYGVTWNAQPAKGNSVGSTSFSCATGWQTLDITGLAQQWYQGSTNRGVTLWANNESASGGVFRSRECTTAQCPGQEHPQLRIDYTVPTPQSLNSIAGRVTGSGSAALSGVRVTLNTGQHSTTDANGAYLFTDLSAGSYTITPQKDYYTFSPAQRTVSVGPDAGGQDFTGSLPDSTFRPNPNGYSFDNYGGVKLSDYTLSDMRRMFGDSAVCWMVFGVCVPKPAAVAWNVSANNAMKGGHCDGMASTSLLFFKGFANPGDFQSGATRTYDLALANARRNIAYYFVEQLTNPVRDVKAQSVQNVPREILRQLSVALSNGAGDPPTLFVRQRQPNGGMSGHAITPYAISDRGGGVYWIHVYDNNYPNDADRHVVVDTGRNTWSYQIFASATWQGDASTHTLGIVPVSQYRAAPACPWCGGNQRAIGSFPYEGVWTDSAAHLSISDSQGRVIGYVGNKLVNDLDAGAVAIIDAGGDVALEPFYTFPLSDTYTVLLDGQILTTTETPVVSFFGEGHAATVEGIVLDATTQDRVALSPDGHQIAYQASRDQEATLTMLLEDSAQSGQFTIRGADVISGQMVALGVDTASKYLVFTNQQDESGVYSVDIQLAGAESTTQFAHTNLDIAPLDTHYLSYGEWDGEGDMTVYIDHGQDGSIDETVAVTNQTDTVFLPLVIRQ
ncbi:MAG TPA: DNRLRE domain-containing protein [Anaerolineae bacterium]|nr:DNRLRE domain-containing protein [Anaerolineae bacterium]HQH37380.1 DNRLRE domain-containing protein [Anaerolineae bacterium]